MTASSRLETFPTSFLRVRKPPEPSPAPIREPPDPPENPDSTLNPDSIAQTYLDVLRQPRDAWSFEVELRPWVESF